MENYFVEKNLLLPSCAALQFVVTLVTGLCNTKLERVLTVKYIFSITNIFSIVNICSKL